MGSTTSFGARLESPGGRCSGDERSLHPTPILVACTGSGTPPADSSRGVSIPTGRGTEVYHSLTEAVRQIERTKVGKIRKVILNRSSGTFRTKINGSAVPRV